MSAGAIVLILVIVCAFTLLMLRLIFDNMCKHNYKEIDRVKIKSALREMEYLNASSQVFKQALIEGDIITYKCEKCGKLHVVRALNELNPYV